MSKMRCAIIGIGYLGKFHAEKYQRLAKTSVADLVAVCDSIPDRADQFAKEFNTQAIYDYTDLVGKVDAVSIVTPTSTHHQIAKFFLEHNIHVLLEKPITSTLAEADELIAVAKKQNLVLQIGHLERFNNAVIAVEPLINQPNLIELRRLATFKPRNLDVNVVLDLMIHDLDLIQHLIKSPIKSIRANGQNLITDSIDIAHAHIEFENNCVANLTSNRVSLHNERLLQIFQKNAHISCDLNTKRVSIQKKLLTDINNEEHNLEQGDAILTEIQAFLDSIINKRPAAVSAEDGRSALAAAIQISNLIETQIKIQNVEFEPL